MSLDESFVHFLNSLGERYEFSVLLREIGHPRNNDGKEFTFGYSSANVLKNASHQIDSLVDLEKMVVIPRHNAHLLTAENYKHIKLPIENKMLVQKYILNAFKFIRQVPCKAISKEWIKVIEPKKKTKFPYIKGDITKPAWWPADVEHREPDHLQKPDRLKLMCCIVIEVLPRLNNLSIVEEMERATYALSLLKRDPVKEEVIKSVFRIVKATINRDSMVSIIDLLSLKSKPASKSNSKQRQYIKNRIRSYSGVIQQSLDTTEQTESEISEKSYKDQTPIYDNELKLQHSYNTDITPLPTPVLIDFLIDSDPDLTRYIENMCKYESSPDESTDP
ncbi:hypothetical protein Kpol_1033p14 [Vanderwaltozyma polyspora DSM 70294]|uniref:Subtelomeric hrmA-associated cluster protein AFUB-079030/YDR124W-like helical bundle domain-containing protein n=1 Tax=Vanderwaltozyma polyspora (strain ATCC 22028 / DSM 70294 / BCRC 21397 / CBS 2163 / NBRC 10782 / NRRL Y-8283 / UCD 57-17) TaxID=436907 RepID=A7TJ12_VANPO|nr:uncharacterized protein Kpol_1033p14 [Vanderwaltozyma polyspora DSM 70294]EDO17711.1 hypothetical protein Kpol_1033p14 [Vanderwaltozyma polyspora DSM 70294]